MVALIPAASRFVRPLNTDWNYTARILPTLPSYCAALKVALQQNMLADAETNARYSLSIARARGFKWLPRRWDYSLTQDCPVSAHDVRRARANWILTYERYPRRDHGLPVAWITSPSYADVCAELGYTPAEFDREVAWKHARANQAARLIFTTQVSLENFLTQTNEALRAKSTVIPFLLTGLTAQNNAATTQKWKGNDLKLLFVGREARRKGLPVVLEAVLPILKENSNISFTVVSRMDDGPVEIPTLPNLTFMRETQRSEVLRLMSEAHVLTMPSSRESYGFVYIEAMSQGCIPLALDSPVQHELLEDGGILLAERNAEDLRAALLRVVAERETYLAKAQQGVSTFRTKHAPEIVAAQFLHAMAQV